MSVRTLCAENFGDVVVNQSTDEREVAALQKFTFRLWHLVSLVDRRRQRLEDRWHDRHKHLLQERNNSFLKHRQTAQRW